MTQTQPETEAGYYSYDFGKRRIGRNWDSDGWTWSVYGQDSVVSEYDSTGSQQNRYEYAGGAVVRGEQDGYYFSDAQGSVTFVAGTEPQVTRTEYDPWGVILSGARDGSTISYTGQWRDDQTGLMPLGNGERYYDPLLGRFIQEDSFAGMYTLPISLNRYIYGHDNPLVYFDPTGMAAEMAARGETHELLVHWSNQSGFWNQVGGWGGLALYEFVNTLTLGGVERGDRTGTAYARGEISGGEATFRSVANISLSTVHLVASAATGGISLLAEAGVFAGLTAVQQFGIENYEMAYEGRQSLSSLQDYVVNAALAGGMTIGLGFVGRVANQARVMSQAKTIKEGVEVPHGMLDLLTGAAKKVVHQELALMAQELQPLRQFASRMSPGRQLDVAVEGRVGKANKARREIGCGLKLCFAAGTPVQTRDGQRNIEDLRVGDEVLSYNEQTGQTEYQPITALYAHQNALVLNVTVEGEPEPLKVTPEHPFLAYRARNDLSSEDPDPDSQPKGEWIEAGHLKIGDQLRTATGTWVAITDIKAGGSVEWAYNVEIATTHSYYVGINGFLAHNIDCDDPVEKFFQEYEASEFLDVENRLLKATDETYRAAYGRSRPQGFSEGWQVWEQFMREEAFKIEDELRAFGSRFSIEIEASAQGKGTRILSAVEKVEGEYTFYKTIKTSSEPAGRLDIAVVDLKIRQKTTGMPQVLLGVDISNDAKKLSIFGKYRPLFPFARLHDRRPLYSFPPVTVMGPKIRHPAVSDPLWRVLSRK